VADARARLDLVSLVARQPTEVHRYEGTELVTQPAAVVAQGDVLLVKPREVVPVDGVVARGAAVLDESTVTGEAFLWNAKPQT
jgi:P-type E1-E2 ATPase